MRESGKSHPRESAHRVTVTGWVCSACDRYYGDGAGAGYSARACCSGQEMTPLHVAREVDSIVIRISKERLVSAADKPWDEVYGYPHGMRILDAGKFLDDVLSELVAEEEDGTTLVHRMLDAALVNMLEHGAESVASDEEVADA